MNKKSPGRPSPNPTMIIIGGGNHAQVVVEALRHSGAAIKGYVDPNPQIKSIGKDIYCLGDNSFVFGRHPDDGLLVNGIGSINHKTNTIRRDVFELFLDAKYMFSQVVHPTSIVSPHYQRIGEGTIILEGAIIQADVNIGKNVLINAGVIIIHNCMIHDHCHIGPGAILCGAVTCMPNVFVGAGSTIIQGIVIGKDSVIGAGAVVIKDVEPNTTVVGSPAKELPATTPFHDAH